ncbi:hypothetical protein AVEN_97871-1 [Araneus ventricosus]|uniref:Uncharacterized protein n=1 Tax=Araneus ventricosus TaxID=182803 RepID=A0A4Y2F551_ARAVE|nr:hypothetical protein AVEN_97871-1 [Araneus ventricosus]
MLLLIDDREMPIYVRKESMLPEPDGNGSLYSSHKSPVYSVVISTPCFEPTQELFWDRSHNFELGSDDEDDTRAGTPSPNFHTKCPPA